MPPSIQGQNGSRAIFAVARVLKVKFSLDDETAMALMREWNANHAIPPWSEHELRRKFRSAGRRVASASASGGKSPRKVSDAISTRPKGADLPAVRGNETRSEFMQRSKDSLKFVLASGGFHRPETTPAEKRATWPAFRTPSDAELSVIGRSRGARPEVVGLLSQQGLIRVCEEDGHLCWAVLDRIGGTFAQVRRLDGLSLSGRDGPLKEKNLWGSEGGWIQPFEFGRRDIPIVIAEGVAAVVDVVEAMFRAEWLMKMPLNLGILCAASSGSRLTPELLAALAGRRIRIFPDRDTAGISASEAWTDALVRENCSVDRVFMPDPCKDVGVALLDCPALAPFWSDAFNLTE